VFAVRFSDLPGSGAYAESISIEIVFCASPPVFSQEAAFAT